MSTQGESQRAASAAIGDDVPALVLDLVSYLRRWQQGEDVFVSVPREPRPLPPCASKLQQARSQRKKAS